MEVRIEDLAKRFSHRWVFRHLSSLIPSSARVAVTGPNGAGKSTLLKILSGALPATEGKVSYTLNGKPVQQGDLYRHVSFAAPYADLIEEMSLQEAWQFHRRFKQVNQGKETIEGLLAALGYPFKRQSRISEMSSGMKQRIRLAFAFFSEVPLLLLDEPTTNLDDDGIRWFHQILAETGQERTVVIASNDRSDLRNCEMEIGLSTDE